MKKSFSEALKRIRTSKRISQQSLADEMGVDRSSVAHWENGTRLPSLETINALANTLGVDSSIFLEKDDNTGLSQNIMIVDDEEIALNGAISVLNQIFQDKNIVGFTKSSEAIEYVKAEGVSIAFLDIEIGKSSGIDLCRRLLEINPSMNVIFLTSYPGYSLNAWDTGASGFLVKPLKISDVKKELSKLRHPIVL